MMPTDDDNRMEAIDITAVRERLAQTSGRAFWRSLDELAETPAFTEFLKREFPRQSAAWNIAVDRRAFLSVMGASLALAGLNGCAIKQPKEVIVPYIDQPDGLTPNVPLFFATAVLCNGFAQPVLVTSREGRPIKVEGNPTHPASRGATDALTQAALLSLYDPDRSQQTMNRGLPSTYDNFLQSLIPIMEPQKATGGASLRLLTGTVTSPTLTAQIKDLLTKYPAAKWCQYEPVGQENTRDGAKQAFGADVRPLYHFEKAAVVVSLDGDFLLTMPNHVRYASDFAAGRRVTKDGPTPNRLYMAESVPTITGAMAEHRLARTGRRIEILAQGLATLINGGVAPNFDALGEDAQKWVIAAAADLQANRGRGIIVVGERQPASIHALAHRLNQALGNVGQTVTFIEPAEADAGTQSLTLAELVAEMRAGQTQALVIADSNPAYTAPADFTFGELLLRVPYTAHLGGCNDETAALCQWHIPETHSLESWGDARSYDGTITILQPLIAPLYQTHTAHELLSALLLEPARSDHDIIRDYWQAQRGAKDFNAFWRTALNDGLIAGSALQLAFMPDPTVWDGRFANNGWLQELPKPLSKLTWDNALLISPRTAQDRKLDTGDVVRLTFGGRSVEVPVCVLPGHAPDSATLTLGYGRTRAGNVGNGAGSNAYALRTSTALWQGLGAEITKLNRKAALAITHSHNTMEGRDIVRAATITEFRKDEHVIHRHDRTPERPESLYPDYAYPDYAWAMSIDLNTCIGCNACVMACQSENNIPVVGKAEVLRGREMHWIRIDRYYEGRDLDNRPRPISCRYPVCTANRRPANSSAPSGRHCTTATASTRWSTIAAWGRATAPITAPTKCAASTFSSTQTTSR